MLKAGLDGNCLRVLVPLVATDEQLDEALDVFEETLTAPRRLSGAAGAGRRRRSLSRLPALQILRCTCRYAPSGSHGARVKGL